MANDYKLGKTTAFTVNAISHLESIRRRELNKRNRIMQNEFEEAQKMQSSNNQPENNTQDINDFTR